MYKFQKYGTLYWYNGVPVYMGGKLITKNRMAFWWPINWVVVIVTAPYIIYKVLTDKS